MRTLLRVVASAMISHIVLVGAAGRDGIGMGEPAWAQSAGAAEALFDKGLEAMLDGRFDEACPALAESYRIDPKAGGLFTLAECENKAGKLASAVAHYQDYLRLYQSMTSSQQASQRGRDQVATEQIDALKPRVPTLSISLDDDAPVDTKVFRDGVRLGNPSLGLALPVDPGEHAIRAEAAGKKPMELTVVVAEGKTEGVVIVFPAASPIEEPPPPPPPPNINDQDSALGLTPVALVVGGVGVVGLIVGGITGAMVFGQKSTVDDNCVDQVCNAAGIDAVDTADSLGTVSTIGFIAGAALLSAAVVMLLVDDSDADQAQPIRLAPQIATTQAGATLTLRF